MPERPEENPDARRPDPCAAVGELLEAYVDGELEAAGRRRVREHCADCRPCAAALARAAEVKAGLARLPALSCPPRVTRAVLARAAAEAAVGRRGGFSRRLAAALGGALRPALAAALLAVAVASALLLGRIAPPPGRSEPSLSPAELARTEAEVKLAFAYLGRIGRQAGRVVRAEVVANVISPTRRALGAAATTAEEARE